ncbi:MAG: DUF2442 domain-containing protein [Clostridia bacterium]|nr:DUF2442 domain-containing protein [Clostridia bacterium]
MYILNGIVYAGDQTPPLKAVGVRPLADHQLWVRFSTGEAKIFNCKELLKRPAFLPLNDEKVFRTAYIDFGTVTWNDGNIDISTERLYQDGTPAEEVSNA